MKILLAADGSRFTQIAARYLVDYVKWFAKPPEVHVLHVHPPSAFPRAAAVVGNAAVLKAQREDSRAALAVAETELAGGAVPFTSSWAVGDVSQELAKHVKAHAIDLVLMGSRGHGALVNLALGSVAMKCIATLEAPILIVRNLPPPQPVTRRQRTYGPRKA